MGRSRWFFRVIHDHEQPLLAAGPIEGDDRVSFDREQSPGPLAQRRRSQSAQEPLIERCNRGIDPLLGGAAELHRQPHAPPLQLALMEEFEPRGEIGDEGRRTVTRAECDGGALLVVVLEEPREARLEREVCAQMGAHS